MNPEDELRAALRRIPAPPRFAAKVLAKTRVPVWRRPLIVALAAGLAVTALIPPAVSEYRRREELRGLEAGRELLIVLRLTRAKLLHVKERVQMNAEHTL